MSERKRKTMHVDPKEKFRIGAWTESGFRHSQRPQREHGCPLCLSSFKTEEGYRAHWKEKHSRPSHASMAHANIYHAHRWRL